MPEAFASDMAARRFHKRIPELTHYQKYEILSEYMQMKMGEAWQQSEHAVVRHYFLSFEYAFGKPMRFAEQALFLTEELEQLAQIMGTDYRTLLREEELPHLGFGTPGRFGAGWMQASTEAPCGCMGYGLRYRSGFIAQYIIKNRPINATDYIGDPARHPWEIRTEKRYEVRFNGETLLAEAIDFPIPGMGGNPIHYVRLWDVAETSRIDTAEFRAGEYVKAYHQTIEPRRLVEFVYPEETNDPGKKLRLMQEYFFASATMQDILSVHVKEKEALPDPIDIYLNEIHPTLAIPECLRLLTEQYGHAFSDSVKWVQESFRYGNQILTDEAFESWAVPLLEETVPVIVPVLRKMDEYAKNHSPVFAVQAENARGLFRDDRVVFPNICAYFCRAIHAFSQTHKKQLSKRLGLDTEKGRSFIRLLAPRLSYVKTLQRTSPKMYECLLEDNCTVQKLAQAKMEKKQAFAKGLEDQSIFINPYSIFSVHIGNFHENNRQLLILLYIANLHRKLLDSPHLDIPDTTFLFSGLAYPGYLMATETVHLINAYGKWLSRDTLIENKLRIVFMEDINTEMERTLLSVADIYQAIRLPAHATLPMYVPEAILQGAAVFSSRHGYTESLAQSLADTKAITLFEEGKGQGEAMESLQFIIQNKKNLDFDAATIASLLRRYQDSFSVMSSFQSYAKEMTKCTQAYLNADAWNHNRAMSQRKMWQILKNTGDLPCDGR